MAEAGSGSNVRLTGPTNVWFDQNQPTDLHLTVNDVDLIHPQSGKDGLHLVFSSRPTSANFDPKTFNTLRALLERFAKPGPPESADESIPRRLDSRRKHMAANAPTTEAGGGDRVDELGLAGWFDPEQRARLRGLDVDAFHSLGLAGPWTPELVLGMHELGERRVAESIHELGVAGPLSPEDLAVLLAWGMDEVLRIAQDEGLYGCDPSELIAALKRRA
jgi:hypothetical protein